MPYRCFVPHCKRNYKNSPKVFSFPKDKRRLDSYNKKGRIFHQLKQSE